MLSITARFQGGLFLTAFLFSAIVFAQSDVSLNDLSAENNEIVEKKEVVTPAFAERVNGLTVRSLSKLSKAIELIAESDNPRKVLILQSLLDGKLFQQRSDKRVVIAAEHDGDLTIYDAANGESLGGVEKSSIKMIKLSNRLRSKLRIFIAELQLNSDDPELRLTAIKELSKNPDQKTLALLKQIYEKELSSDEGHEAIENELELTLALQDLGDPEKAKRSAAIKSLMDKTSLVALNKLKVINAKDEQGRYLESDPKIRKLARQAIVKIESRLHFYETVETVFFGLSLGAVLVLAAIGLAITFGVMGVINMAHGELMMLGAYTTYVMQQIMPNHLGLSIILSIPAAFMISGMVGIAIERGIIRYLYGRPLETLLATFGVSLFLQQTVRSIFSPLNRSVSTPEWMSGSWQVNDFLSLTWNRFYILIFCLLVFTLLLQILRQTRLGLEVRAVSQNRNMAKAMGIPTARVDAMTFGLGSGIAGVAGVALSQITNVGPNLGQSYIVDSFMVVVFGGVGNLWGTLVGGFSLGIANKFLEPYAGAVLAKILVLVFIILFIQKRPRGLFPQKGRAAEA